MFVEDDAQGLRERRVAIEMVEAKPALLHLRRQTGQPLIYRWPRTEMAETLRPAFFQRLLKMEPSFVVDIMVEVDVDLCRRVGEKKPPRLGNGVTVSVGIDQDGADTQRGLQETFHRIVGEMGLLRHLMTGEAVVAVAQQLEDTELHHQPGGLEDDGAPRDVLCQTLCLTRRELFARILFLQSFG